MPLGRMVFSQLLDFLPKHELHKCVARYEGNNKVRKYSCFDQFLTMMFAQLTGRQSLRDIETCLRAIQPKLYHSGLRSRISRSTLADANEKRDWHIWADFGHVLIGIAQKLYARDPFGVALQHAAYALDSTTIDLCLSLFPWAVFRRAKGAVKLHTLMDLRGSIPCFLRVTHGKTHDLNILDDLIIQPGAFYIMDRAYVDFARLYRITQALGFFVVRGKKAHAYTRRASSPVDKATGLRSDQTIIMRGPKTSQFYPLPLRRISYVDPETRKRFIFLTNHVDLPALTITQLYKCRWQIELFFKWIKQHLCIKAFLGTSNNAVKTQIWIAISTYLLVAIVKKELGLDRKLSEILQILSITLFEKDLITQALTNTPHTNSQGAFSNQLPLFDL